MSLKSIASRWGLWLWLAAALLPAASAHAQSNPDWTTPATPFRIAGNLYYVGSRDLASYLLVTSAGDILINSNLESSVAQIRHSVEQLGYRFSDIRILLISHSHFDHDAGSAEVKRQTGAQYMVMDGDVPVVESGGAKDFQYGATSRYPATKVDRVLHDGDQVRLGDAVLVAHKTPGHTRGCTTFTITINEGGKKLLAAVVGGWASNPGVTYVAIKGKPASYPGIEQDFEHTFAAYKALPIDIFLGAHGVYFNMLPKLDQGARTNPSLWIDPAGYKAAIQKADENFHRELAKEKAAAQ